MRRRAQTAAVLAAVLGLGIGGCDLLLTPASGPEMALSFRPPTAAQTTADDPAGLPDRVHLLLVRPDSARRDTLLPLVVRDGTARARLALRAEERVPALAVVAELRRGGVALFRGQRVVRVEVGAPTSAEIPLEPVVAEVRAEVDSLLMVRGDTTRLAAGALLATGAPAPGAALSWSSTAPDAVSVTEGGLALARAVGSALLVVRHQELVDTVSVRVVARD